LGVTMAASFGSCLPISTPPNAIVYSTGLTPVRRMNPRRHWPGRGGLCGPFGEFLWMAVAGLPLVAASGGVKHIRRLIRFALLPRLMTKSWSNREQDSIAALEPGLGFAKSVCYHVTDFVRCLVTTYNRPARLSNRRAVSMNFWAMVRLAK